MDLSKFDTTTSTYEMAVMHPVTGDPLLDDDGAPVTITFKSPDAPEYRLAQRERAVKRLARVAKTGEDEISADDVEDGMLVDVVNAVESWHGIGLGAKELKCTPDNARLVFDKLVWLREQAVECLRHRANFFPKSKVN